MSQFHFLFSAADQALIDPASIVVDDTPIPIQRSDAGAQPSPGRIYPQSWRITFQALDPADPPCLRPLCAGVLRFLDDPEAPGTLPAAKDVQLTPEAFEQWRTRGTLMLEVDVSSEARLRNALPDLLVRPNRIWYRGVRLTPGFLFETLLARRFLIVLDPKHSVPVDAADWPQQAIAAFLRGTYSLPVSTEASTGDEIEVSPMPAVYVDETTGQGTLVVTAALKQPPLDGRDADLDVVASDLGFPLDLGLDVDPGHPKNGVIPARLIYQSLRSSMPESGGTGGVADAVIPSKVYQPLKLTRCWKPIEESSWRFPLDHVQLTTADMRPIGALRLPPHGVLYLPEGLSAAIPGGVCVTLEGNSREPSYWLDGNQPGTWMRPAARNPVLVTIGATPGAHVLVRRPMGSVMGDEAPVEGSACTYMSLRRTVRALVDNRVAGGALISGKTSEMKARTRLLLEGVLSAELASILRAGGPPPNQDPEKGNAQLLAIVRELFPHPLVSSDGSSTQSSAGQIFSDLWQTNLLRFRGPNRGDYPDELVGRGAPGAAVALGFASFVVDVHPQAHDTTDSECAKNAEEMFDSARTGQLRPGALLQMWLKKADWDLVRDRAVDHLPDPDWQHYGHSPVFREFDAAEQIVVVDQHGWRHCRMVPGSGGRRLKWGDWVPEGEDIWFAANWND